MSFHKYSFPYKETGTGEVRFNCPKCLDTKYHLYYSPSKSLFNCFKCGYKGKGFPTELKAIKITPSAPEEVKIRELDWQELVQPPSCILESVIWDYINFRGLNGALVKKFKLGWSSSKPFVVVFPIIMNTVIKAIQIRHLASIGPKYVFYDVDKKKTKKSLLLYNYDSVVSGVDTLFIMEGVLDVIRASPSSGVCTFGKAVSLEQANLIAGIPKKKLVLAYDTDVKMKELLQTIERLEIYNPVYIKELPPGKDPADMGEAFLGLPEIPSFDWLLRC